MSRHNEFFYIWLCLSSRIIRKTNPDYQEFFLNSANHISMQKESNSSKHFLFFETWFFYKESPDSLSKFIIDYHGIATQSLFITTKVVKHENKSFYPQYI